MHCWQEVLYKNVALRIAGLSQAEVEEPVLRHGQQTHTETHLVPVTSTLWLHIKENKRKEVWEEDSTRDTDGSLCNTGCLESNVFDCEGGLHCIIVRNLKRLIDKHLSMDDTFWSSILFSKSKHKITKQQPTPQSHSSWCALIHNLTSVGFVVSQEAASLILFSRSVCVCVFVLPVSQDGECYSNRVYIWGIINPNTMACLQERDWFSCLFRCSWSLEVDAS